MSRILNHENYKKIYSEYICNGKFQEVPEYYTRYYNRYKIIIRKYCELIRPEKACVLDIGGGQLALLCHKLWNDDAWLADIGGPHLNYLREQGVEVTEWDLCSEQQPFIEKFDFIFFSEVIEHLPIPVHLVLERFRKALKPGGKLICTTPNLYRLRNIVYMICGIQIFDYFRLPKDKGLGHVIEYSYDHLYWQFKEAGFENIEVSYCQIHHSPNNIIFRIMSWFGSPLFLFPRFRDNLIAVAEAPK